MNREIKTLLIANRAEIALRIIRTCKELGIKTVTIYSEDDRSLPHAYSGDLNISLGVGSLSETYLNKDKIIGIAQKYNVDAIHPGYGLLSENALFCEQVQESGITYVGPSIDSIKLMGDKKASKAAMEKIGIPLVPGHHGENQDAEYLLKKATSIGFPLLIKATAGGGGKGMRIVEKADDFSAALESSKREAMNAFGDDQVLLEKYIERPKHIEVQIVSDSHGNHLHFYERECSIQRRYQKVIEETPSPSLSQKLREEICASAVKIAKSINYLGAGTIEYILSEDNKFYFLEMNTRLQVEHPITEFVTGVDLVKLQLEVASGRKLDLLQKDITQSGHALEVRIYAEDPDNEFLPSTGMIKYIGSSPYEGVRIDRGHSDGNFININYDPMLAKLITYDDHREDNIYKMVEAIYDHPFLGAKTNRDYLTRVLTHPNFLEGKTHTHFLKEHKDSLKKETLSSRNIALVMASVVLYEQSLKSNLQTTNIEGLSWGHFCKRQKRKFSFGGSEYEGEIVFISNQLIEVSYHGSLYRFQYLGQAIFMGDELRPFYCTSIKSTDGVDRYHLCISNLDVFVDLIAKARFHGASVASEGALCSPMPGKIYKILKSVGEKVSVGEPILILEAMKMEHTIKATSDGEVKSLFFKEGDQVVGGAELCEIKI